MVGYLVPAMNAGAEWVFVLASTGLVAYSIDRLDVLRVVERLLKFWPRKFWPRR